MFSNFHAGMSSCRPKFHVGSHVKGLLVLSRMESKNNFDDTKKCISV